MSQIKFNISTLSLTPTDVYSILPYIKEVGFDGVEFSLPPKYSPDFIANVKRKCGKLESRFHEIRSLENNPNHMLNYVATCLGKISRKTEPLHVQIPNEVYEDVTCYAWRHEEIAKTQGLKGRRQLQTCNTVDHTIQYKEFLKIVYNENFDVVFDTQHVLEMWEGCLGFNNLRKYTRLQLFDIMMEAWNDLSSHTKVIHFNNFDPRGGYSCGRNCWPDQGILDLKSFAYVVKKSGWSGVVIPEVTPRSINRGIPIPLTPLTIPLSKPRLGELRNLIGRMFN